MGYFLASGGLQGLMGNQTFTIVIYVVFLIAIMYFLMIRPQKQQEKKQKELLNSLAVGDSVLTTSGFYGIIIDMTADTVIVEFGNNKNCRIPMQKAAIVKSEKPKFKAAETQASEKK